MKGAIIGDIVGSRFEYDNTKSKNFELFTKECHYTDDTVMTIAVADALVNGKDFGDTMREYGRKYPDADYGTRFYNWLFADDPTPYYSYGNGAPMRCSACGLWANTYEDAMRLARQSAVPSHNHPEAIKAAEVTAGLIYLFSHHRSTDNIAAERERFEELIGAYDVPTLSNIRRTYTYDVSSRGTMPVVLAAFNEADGFEDCIRNAISVGGDSDTIAAIAGSIAEAFIGVPDELWEKAKTYLPQEFIDVVDAFYEEIDVIPFIHRIFRR